MEEMQNMSEICEYTNRLIKACLLDTHMHTTKQKEKKISICAKVYILKCVHARAHTHSDVYKFPEC